MLAFLIKAPRVVHQIALGAIVFTARLPLIRGMIFLVETFFLRRTIEATTTPGPTGRAMGYLFGNHDPELSAKDIYRDVFSPERFEQGYQSQIGQDMFLNRWFFKDRGPGFFVDVGAYDGIVGSNTFYFEKHLHWNGIAFEPNPPAFEALRANRSCHLIQGCAYDRDGQISFLGLSESAQRKAKSRRPGSVLAMIFDSNHGGAMLGGIPEHMNQVRWVEWIRKAMKLDQTEHTVPCFRIDSVLRDRGAEIVDFLSIDVEGAELEVLRGIDFERVQVNVICIEHNPEFPAVHDLLTTSGFEYAGLLFFDEIFVHKRPRYTWDVSER
ncbi:FkbM family methyltransferase [Mycobacterium sp. 663a-19]|uniref:FkbM family methyltransferase n=1 Tax=Mycobacterium sp. 663a-19 TaxID=2986148 RepID=UPI002D1F7AD6|nr:FkbM family methyltransferase [Mycobacterium sp. 663a-19]MEB3981990.1 FkbM family methyltransferase [Mycobacterium sp. 663a-19]